MRAAPHRDRARLFTHSGSPCLPCFRGEAEAQFAADAGPDPRLWSGVADAQPTRRLHEMVHDTLRESGLDRMPFVDRGKVGRMLDGLGERFGLAA